MSISKGSLNHGCTSEIIMRYGGYIIAKHSRDNYCILQEGNINPLARKQDRGYLSIDECKQVIDMELT